MVSIEVYRAEMFEDVYTTFLQDDDPRSGREQWRRFFEHDWDEDRQCKAYLLCDGGRIVGMLGTLFKRRLIKGCRRWICNTHSWNVLEAYRGRSLSLLRPLLRETDLTITDFSPTPAVYELSLRLGFQPLDGRLTLLPRPLFGRHASCNEDFEIITEPQSIRTELNSADREIFDHHQCSGWVHLLCRRAKGSCYCVASLIDRHWVRYAYIHYLSNPERLGDACSLLGAKVCGRVGTRFAMVDARRLTSCRPRRSLTFARSSRQLYRSAIVAAEDLDTLYSEVDLLQLTTIPSIRSLLPSPLNRSRRR